MVKNGANAAALDVPVPVRGVFAKRHAVHFVQRVGFGATALEVQGALQLHDKVVPPDGIGRIAAIQIPDDGGDVVNAANGNTTHVTIQYKTIQPPHGLKVSKQG